MNTLLAFAQIMRSERIWKTSKIWFTKMYTNLSTRFAVHCRPKLTDVPQVFVSSWSDIGSYMWVIITALSRKQLSNHSRHISIFFSKWRAKVLQSAGRPKQTSCQLLIWTESDVNKQCCKPEIIHVIACCCEICPSCPAHALRSCSSVSAAVAVACVNNESVISTAFAQIILMIMHLVKPNNPGLEPVNGFLQAYRVTQQGTAKVELDELHMYFYTESFKCKVDKAGAHTMEKWMEKNHKTWMSSFIYLEAKSEGIFLTQGLKMHDWYAFI